jgi:lysophospholipase L1-like esterase
MQYAEDYGNFQEGLGTLIKTEWADHETNIERELQKWSETQKAPFLNLTPYFRKLPEGEKKKMHYPLDGHWTPEGQQFVADIIHDWLKKQNWWNIEKSKPYEEASYQ